MLAHDADKEDPQGSTSARSESPPAAQADPELRLQELERRLNESERHRQVILSAVGDVLFFLDAEGRIFQSSGEVKEILGYPYEVWQGKPIFAFTDPSEQDKVWERFQEVLDNPGREVLQTFRARHADGHWEMVEATGVNLLDDPDIGAIVLTSRNITARHEHEQAMARARDEAIAALDHKSEFVASVAHELRTPIHGILGLTELMLQTDLPPDAAELASAVSRATRTLGLILEDLLDYSRLEAEAVQLVPVLFSVTELIHATVDLFQPAADSKHLRVYVEVDDALPTNAVADSLRIGQVLSNLVSNAIKFTSRGSVTVTAEPATLNGGPALRCSVADTGVGFTHESKQRLFEPFSQANATIAVEYGGTGLGLAIVRRLIDLMGGRLGLDSELGIGSHFWFTVPIQPADDSAATEGPAVPTTVRIPRFSGSVLVVEDNPVNQLLVSKQLQRLGCESIIAEGGRRAIELLRTETVDVILMDLQLPDLDGYGTTSRIRSTERKQRPDRRIPIVAMTAASEEDIQARCLDAGMDDFLPKPTSLESLANALGRWLPIDESPYDTGRIETRAARGPDRSSPMIDQSALEQLRSEIGDEGFVIKLMTTYLGELPKRLGAISEAHAAGEAEPLSRAAHSLASPSAMFGAKELSDLCREVERNAGESTYDTASAVATILDLAEKVRADLAGRVERGRIEPE